jgi:hypothetical protein
VTCLQSAETIDKTIRIPQIPTLARYTLFGLALLSCSVVSATASSITPTLYFSDAFDYTNGNPSAGQTYSDYEPNGVTASATGSINGETTTSSASIAAGTLKILNTGNIDPSLGANTASYASLGDTITASGATAGLNLGVNITEDGSAYAVNPGDDSTFLVVAAYTPGVFDTNAYATPLWAAGYQIGADSTAASSGILGAWGISSATGSYGDGSNAIPISIPFASLPSTFDLFVAMGSYENGSGVVWSNDFSHTLNVSLTAPAGVTLSSASDALPGTPEPSTLSMGGLALLAGLAIRLRKKMNSAAVR